VTIRAGASQIDITPPLGIPLAGSWQPRRAESVATPLGVHAVVLETDETKVALVAVDLIALLRSDVDVAKARVSERIGIDPDKILVSCSHTHEAPYPCGLLAGDEQVDVSYMRRVVDAVAEAVVQADAKRTDAQVGWASAEVKGPCQNRRRLVDDEGAYNVWAIRDGEAEDYPAAGPIDEQLAVLAVRAKAGQPIAVIWNFALHAHAFSATMDAICADYPYYVRQNLARDFGEEFVGVYLPGACGDINRPGQTPPEQVVEALATGIRTACTRVEYTDNVPIATSLQPFTAALRDCSAFDEAEIRRKQPESLETARADWQRLKASGQTHTETLLHALAIGEFAIAAVPGEYFCALGLQIKDQSPFALTAVAELSNDYVGYIPTDKAYDEGGYELFTLQSSKVARGTGERMAKTLIAMLQQLR
jgi:hypothetical protein